MLEFIRSVYRVFVLVGFWVFLIICTIGGGVLADLTYSVNTITGASSGIHPVLGGFIGLIVGFIFDVLILGFIATILNIDDNLEKLKFKINSFSTGGGFSGSNLSSIQPVKPGQINFGDTWTCKKCNERNSINSPSCKGCGGYK